jgi:hypothetical protein
MKSIIKNFINEIALRTYKKISPDFFPATWDVASDVERICKGKKPQTIFDVGANIGQNSEQNSLLDGLTKLSSSEEKTATVKIESLDRFCQEKGIETIDLLKIYTEG